MSKILKFALICLVIGTVLIVFAVASGFDRFGIGFGFKDIPYTMEKMELKNIKEIDIDFEYSELLVERTEDSTSSLEYPVYEDEDLRFDIEEKDGKITIRQNFKKRFVGVNSPKLPLTKLYLAKGTELENLIIKSNFGKVTTQNLLSKNGQIKLNAGEYKSYLDDFSNIVIDADMGAIVLNQSKLKNATISSNMGEISGKISPDGLIKFDADMGAIDIGVFGTKEFAYELDAEMGEATFNGSKVEKGQKYRNEFDRIIIEAKAEMGSVELKEY